MCVGPAVFLGDMEKGPHGPESMNMIKPCVLFFFSVTQQQYHRRFTVVNIADILITRKSINVPSLLRM